MSMYEVYSHSIQKRYKTTIFSQATFFQIICIVLTYLSPFLIAFFAGGFWIPQQTYTVQPIVQFKYNHIVILETDDNFIISTTYENINDILASNYRSSYRTVQEIDANSDYVSDYLKWTIEIPVDINEVVLSVKLLLVFNYTIASQTNLQFESSAFLDSTNPRSGSELSFSGSLNFLQNQLLRTNGFNRDYSISPINVTNPNLEDLLIENILNSYYSRPFSTKLDTNYVIWRTSSNINTFRINAIVNYSNQTVQYIPGFWQQFKWGWIQYICVLLPFMLVFKLIKIFTFENQLLSTVVMMPKEKIQ